KAGLLPALRAGMRVELRVATLAEKKVVSIQAEGPQVFGVVKTVNAEKHTITLFPDARGAENTFRVAKDARIEIDGKPGKVAGLPPGVTVTLSMFVDHNTAGSIQATGPQVIGFLKAFDAQKNTITVAGTQWNRWLGKQLPIDRGGDNTFTLGTDADVR